jgi:hypothetical protein
MRSPFCLLSSLSAEEHIMKFTKGICTMAKHILMSSVTVPVGALKFYHLGIYFIKPSSCPAVPLSKILQSGIDGSNLDGRYSILDIVTHSVSQQIFFSLSLSLLRIAI